MVNLESQIKIRRRKEVPYFQVENNIFDMKCPLKPNDFVVYLYLTRLTNSARNVAYPSYETIATSCNVSRSTAIRSVKNLESMKLLELVKQEKGKSNSYYVNQYTDVFDFVCKFYGHIADTSVTDTLVSEGNQYQSDTSVTDTLVSEGNQYQSDTSVTDRQVSEKHSPSITGILHQYQTDTAGSVTDTPNKEIEIKKEDKEILKDEEDKKKEKEILQFLSEILLFDQSWQDYVLNQIKKHKLQINRDEMLLMLTVCNQIEDKQDIKQFEKYFFECYLNELRSYRYKKKFNQKEF